MKTLNKIGIGVAFAASTLAFSTVGISSAQAFIVGEVNLAGNATIFNSPALDPLTETVSFSEALILEGAQGSFTSLPELTAGQVTLSNLDLNRVAAGEYTGSASNPFITFANGWTFDIDNPFTAVRATSLTPSSGLLTTVTTAFSGSFFDGSGTTIGAGVLTANNIINGSFSATLTATQVPEPTTTLGLAALGLGAFFSSSLAKKKKNQVSA
ncbi:PEP-CTERM sorting domain-containing protein [Nodularia harveyana UHCC-0300]|uniref:PEP-CTERM sorting domain-containing protein n=1 Tax=Nodularia harveyana UHCC-0300 TaxID=2974287 RepID=A0ABU5UG29_9CYAN|nr:PEP-CTERM sorting domain-containing protein [Nodularia harveyana]MEA5582494.1 PEP-CTERM sorting domain-containing protein [Nodularia harveyana UHCC-0300]